MLIGRAANTASPTLVRAHSSDDLKTHLTHSLLEKYGTFDESAESEFILASDDVGTAPSNSATFSSTTLQHSGVDESDRLKTDGRYLYIAATHTPSIKIVEASSAAPLLSEVSLQTQHGAQLSGLYLRKDHQQLIALASGGHNNRQNASAWFSDTYWKSRKTEIFTLDISEPEAPTAISKLTLDGKLISSRRIGSILYLATRHTATLPDLIEYPENSTQARVNHSLISDLSLESLLPTYEINNEKQALFNAQDCLYAGKSHLNYSQHSVISLLAIDLNDAVPTPKGQCFVGDVETVYASADAIYLATTQYQYTNDVSEVIYKGSPSTQIHKFTLDGLHTDYAGSASIEGHLGWQQNQKALRMSEENGILRVLSYVGAQADSIESPARLHVLKQSANDMALDIIATLPNAKQPQPLGKKGEHIYASRFIGDRGYLVTFQNTDPLYILDLSDPSNPYILSALNIEGYSDLLHPVGENYLLGVGKEAIAQTPNEDDFTAPRGAWYQGVKLSLIDISDPSSPFEKQTIVLGKRGSETAASITHHALTTLRTGNTLQVNLPVSLHEEVVDNYGAAAHPVDHFGWTQEALYRFDIDINRGEISALKPIVAKMNDVPEDAAYYYDTGWQYDRSAIINGDAYYLKRDEIFTLAD